MVEDPIKSISEYRTSTLSAVKESVAATYSSVNKLSSIFLRDDKYYVKAV